MFKITIHCFTFFVSFLFCPCGNNFEQARCPYIARFALRRNLHTGLCLILGLGRACSHVPATHSGGKELFSESENIFSFSGGLYGFCSGIKLIGHLIFYKSGVGYDISPVRSEIMQRFIFELASLVVQFVLIQW